MVQVFKPANLRVEYDVKTEMRDDVSLSSDIYFPIGTGPWPVILIRTPYNNQMPELIIESATYFAQNGYVVISQDVRGRFDSDGIFEPWVNEFNDGYDTIEWIGKQPWCNGNVGMHGPSYVGNVQWQAAAMNSKYLKAIVPRVIGDNLHEAPHYQGGALQLGWTATWSFRMGGRTAQDIDIYDWTQVFHTLPLQDLPKTAGKSLNFYDDWMKHPNYDEYWKKLAIKERYSDIKIPILQIGGWYDFFTAGTLNNFVGMKENGGSELARKYQRAIIGPWTHSFVGKLTYAGNTDYSSTASIALLEIELAWFAHWLKEAQNKAELEAPLKLFIMGSNKWRDEYEWPLKRTNFTSWYFHSSGNANSAAGFGTLSKEKPDKETPDYFTYNPMFPVPTKGGCNCCDPHIIPWGSYDQREVQARSDVLVYTSDKLDKPMEVTGPITVKLFASTDCLDTDFTAKLVDVYPDGRALNLCDGIIRARYRNSTVKQELLEPNKIYEFTIDLWPTSNVFKPGHKIRVDISSSNFPRFDRNTNTGNNINSDSDLKTANQTVYHETGLLSQIILPTIPN